jgi:hypothetical protein
MPRPPLPKAIGHQVFVIAYRTQLLTRPEATAAAPDVRREEPRRLVVHKAVLSDRDVASIEWTPSVRPFFANEQRECPQGDSNP